jgi:hypothetical protein
LLLGFNHKERGNMFLQNNGWFSTDYSVSYPRT